MKRASPMGLPTGWLGMPSCSKEFLVTTPPMTRVAAMAPITARATSKQTSINTGEDNVLDTKVVYLPISPGRGLWVGTSKRMVSNLVSFIVGSSLPAVGITMSYLGAAYRTSKYRETIPYELFPLMVPLFLGTANVINMRLVSRYGANVSLLVGLVVGLLMSLLGRFGLDLPRKLFGMPQGMRHRVHVIAPLLYAVLYRVVMTPLTKVVSRRV